MDSSSNNSSNSCSSTFTEKELMVLGISEASAAILSTLGCVAIFLIMIIFKKYTSQTQRLILYLAIAVFLLNIGYIVRGFGYSQVTEGSFCTGIAFFTQYSGGCILLAVVCVVIELCLHGGILQRDFQSLDKLYIPVIFILPLVVDWIPLVNNGYGPTQSWCWIRNIDFETCELFLYGAVLQYALWFIPLFVTIVTGSIFYIIAHINIHKQAKMYTGKVEPRRRTEKDEVILEIKQYRWYPPIFLVFNGIPFAARLIGDINPTSQYTFPLWIAAAIVQGLQGCVIALIFTLDPGTRKRLKPRNITAAVKYNVLNRDSTHEYPVIECDTDSAVKSITDKDTIKIPLLI